jgi:hypothetical protein
MDHGLILEKQRGLSAKSTKTGQRGFFAKFPEILI